MIIIDRRLEKKIIRHVLCGGALSDLRLPFRTVIDALRNAAVGGIGDGGTYAISFDPLLCVAHGIKGGPEGIRLFEGFSLTRERRRSTNLLIALQRAFQAFRWFD